MNWYIKLYIYIPAYSFICTCMYMHRIIYIYIYMYYCVCISYLHQHHQQQQQQRSLNLPGLVGMSGRDLFTYDAWAHPLGFHEALGIPGINVADLQNP